MRDDVAIVILRELVVQDPDREREQRDADDRAECGEQSLLHASLRGGSAARWDETGGIMLGREDAPCML